MTEIEAIKEIEERVQITEHVGGSYVDCVDIEALRIAIFALKQMEKKQLPGENATSDCISRQGLRECLLSEDYETHDYCFPCKKIMKRIDEQPSAQPERLMDEDFETIRIHLSAYKEKLGNQHRWKEAEEYQRIIDRFMAFASAQPEIEERKEELAQEDEGWRITHE